MSTNIEELKAANNAADDAYDAACQALPEHGVMVAADEAWQKFKETDARYAFIKRIVEQATTWHNEFLKIDPGFEPSIDFDEYEQEEQISNAFSDITSAIYYVADAIDDSYPLQRAASDALDAYNAAMYDLPEYFALVAAFDALNDAKRKVQEQS